MFCRWRSMLAVSSICLFLFGCDVPNISTDSEIREGAFLDSYVAGLRYASTSTSGFTGPNGEFDYVPGETVSFFIGNLKLGESTGRRYVTPLHLLENATVEDAVFVNMLRLLQTLDNDDNPDNGIDLTRLSSSTLEDADSVDLADDASLASIINEFDAEKTLIEAAQAIAHFQTQVAEFDLDIEVPDPNTPDDSEYVEQQIIVGENGLSGTWKVEYTVSVEDAQGVLQSIAVDPDETTGEWVPLTEDKILSSPVFQPIKDQLPEIEVSLESRNSHVVSWHFQNVAGAQTVGSGTVLFTKISATQAVFISPPAFAHADAVWQHHYIAIDCYVSPAGRRVCNLMNDTVEAVSGTIIPTKSDEIADLVAQSALPMSGLFTTSYQDTHWSDYYIPAYLGWTRKTENSPDEMGGHYFQVFADHYSLLKTTDYLDNIDAFAFLQLSGTWQHSYQYHSVDTFLNIDIGEPNAAIPLADVPTTLPGVLNYLDNYLGFVLGPGTYYVQDIRATEESVDWKIHYYITGTPGERIGYIEFDLFFEKGV